MWAASGNGYLENNHIDVDRTIREYTAKCCIVWQRIKLVWQRMKCFNKVGAWDDVRNQMIIVDNDDTRSIYFGDDNSKYISCK